MTDEVVVSTESENVPSKETTTPVTLDTNLNIAPVEAEKAKPTEPLSINEPVIEAVTYEPSGNASLDLVHKFLGSVGIGGNSEEYAAAEEGDFSKLEAKLKALGNKAQGYEMYLEVAKQAREQVIKEKMEKHGATINAIHEIVGGESGWKEMSEWVRATASEQELKEINETLSIGGRGAILVAQDLFSLYQEHGKNEPETTTNAPQSPVNKDAPASPSRQAQGALSPSEFRAALSELLDREGTQAMTSPEYEQLFKRAQRYKG